MSGIIKVKSDINFDAIQISDHAGDRQVIARWLMDAGMIPADSWTVDTAKDLAKDLDRLQASYIVHAPTGEVTIVSLEDFSQNFVVIGEGDPLDELEKEFSMPELSDELKEHGEFTTEVIWQCFEEIESFPAQWWDALDELNAIKRTNASAKNFGTEAMVRSRTQISIIGPWKETKKS